MMLRDSESNRAPDLGTLLGWWKEAGAVVETEARADGSTQHTVVDGALRVTLVRRKTGSRERAWYVAEGPAPGQTVVGNVQNAADLRAAIAWVKQHWGVGAKR